MNKQRRWGKRMLAAAVLTLLMVGLTGCGNQQGAESSQPETMTREIALGERAAITVSDGENEKIVGYLTFDEITLTDRRLEGDTEEKRIAAIRYTYENTDIESGMMISSLQLVVKDSAGAVCEGYALTDKEALPALVEKKDKHTAVQFYVLKDGSELQVEYHHVVTDVTPMLRLKTTVQA